MMKTMIGVANRMPLNRVRSCDPLISWPRDEGSGSIF
jgi:hypothetical protein